MSCIHELAADAKKANRRRRGWMIEAVVLCVCCLVYLIFAGPYLIGAPDWASVFVGFLLIPLLVCWGASLFHRAERVFRG